MSETGIDACDGYLRTVLIWAAFHNNIALINWLVEKGANINHQDRNGYTALHFVTQEKRFDCAELLIDKGADLELSDNHGNTPLWTAIFNSRGENQIVKLLIKHGANPDHINNHQRTPRKLAEMIQGFDLSSLEKQP
ncbi:hypothetical protein SDC9_66566 [bioreactor metagenome]|uniref:Uncharacterized protein n=1 Tax=bioreactor metagenome TaxID=1076179 RepID=A0A644XW43_9ZZZZ